MKLRELLAKLKEYSKDPDTEVTCGSSNSLAIKRPGYPIELLAIREKEIWTLDPARKLLVTKISERPSSASRLKTPPSRFEDLRFTIFGRETVCASVSELLVQALEAIEDERPGTLLRLSHVENRTTRIIADAPAKLSKTGRPVKYTRQVKGGWYVSTGNGRAGIRPSLRRASELAGLKWGSEFEC